MIDNVSPRLAAVAAPFDGDSVALVVLVGIVVALGLAVIAGVRASRAPVRASRRRPPATQGAPAPRREGSFAELTELPPTDEPRSVRVLEILILVLLGGYVFFDRAFAWIHLPGTPLFLGELVIAAGVVVLLGMHTRIGDVTRTSAAMKVMLLFMAWGAVLLVGALPTWGEDAIRDAAVWYYAIVAVFVIVLIVSDPRRVSSWLRIFGKIIPWMLVWFPVAIILDAAWIDRFPLVPDSNIPIVSHRTGNIAVMAAAGLGYLWLVDRDSEVFDRRQRFALTMLATVVIMFAAMRNRGGFLAAGMAVFIAFLFLRRERSSMAGIMVGVAVVLLAVGLFGSIRIQVFSEREVSVDQLMNNLVSTVDPDAGGARQESTTKWRLAIWGAVLDDVTNDYPIAGFGPGPDLGKRYNIAGDAEEPLRSPHNSHVGILARMGFVGTALWAVFWLTWFAEMIDLRRRLNLSGRVREAGVAGWLILTASAILVNAIFDPALEGPQVAWWMWGFIGFGIALSVLERWSLLPVIDLGSTRATKRAPVVAGP